MQMFETRSRLGVLGSALLGACALLFPQDASALNAGIEYGIVKRNADNPYNFKLGTGFGAHLELSLLPILNIGPYYLHYELGNPERSSSTTHDSTFDTLGLRARFMLPLPSSRFRPYAYAGIGHTWIRYPSFPIAFEVNNPAMRTGGFETRAGRFYEIPIGIGSAYEIAKIFHLSADFAIRPGMGFGGEAYEKSPPYNEPKWGYSLMLGAALDL